MRQALPLSLIFFAFTGCRASAQTPSPPPLLTKLPRTLSAAELRIVAGGNAFAFDLLREATRTLRPDSNAFLSPLSASMALGMALNGAHGQTLKDMQAALRLTGMSEAELNQGYRSLIPLLRTLDPRTEIRIANSMWARQGLVLQKPFADAARTFFDAQVRTLDFSSPGAVETINEWVSGETNKKIPRLLDQIGDDQVLFLINAIYFKGKWREAFDPKNTRDGPFHGGDGRERSAPLMQQQKTIRYDETEDYQAVDLLYGNGGFAMTVLLPKPGRTASQMLQRMDSTGWKTLTGRFHNAKVSLTLPRFRLEYTRRLNADLEALGMKVAFDPGRADFSRIAEMSPERLYLSRVDQKTFVEVNEEGTEAAAATGVSVSPTSAEQVFEMKVDRPFVFAIRERLSGTVLFLGLMNVIGK
jgi:serine protease inhibitor